MKTVSLSEAKDKLSGLVDEVEDEHEIIQITRHGHGAAVLINQDDLDSLHETIFWLSQPGLREDLAAAHGTVQNGDTLSAEEVRARYGLPKR
jgi:prevent-host-death family protein